MSLRRNEILSPRINNNLSPTINNNASSYKNRLSYNNKIINYSNANDSTNKKTPKIIIPKLNLKRNQSSSLLNNSSKISLNNEKDIYIMASPTNRGRISVYSNDYNIDNSFRRCANHSFVETNYSKGKILRRSYSSTNIRNSNYINIFNLLVNNVNNINNNNIINNNNENINEKYISQNYSKLSTPINYNKINSKRIHIDKALNSYYKNYSNNMNNNYSNNNSNYSNNYQLGKPQRFNNASALPNKNNLNLNNYNNYNYNQKISSQEKEDDDLRPIGGGLTADQVPNVSLPTTPCPHCGRSFNSNAFSKHIKICEKVFLQKRKAYNAQKYRFNDSEQASLMKQGAMKEKMNPLLNKKNEGAIPKWKLQSMAFRAICNPGKNRPVNQNMVNNNKLGTNNNKGGNKINNNKIDNTGYDNIPQTMNYAMAYGYKHCEFCNRNYNEEAYNKHLNFCKRRYENEKLKSKTKKTNSNNSGIKNQYSIF